MAKGEKKTEAGKKKGIALDDIVPEKGKKASEIKGAKVSLKATNIDRMMDLLREKKEISISGLAKELNWSQNSVEKVGLVFEKQGLVDVAYPAMIARKPSIKFIKEFHKEFPPKIGGNPLDEYEFIVDYVPVKIRVVDAATEHRPMYEVQVPFIGPYTWLFLDSMRDEIAEKIPIEVSEITDVKRSIELKKRFFDVAKAELKAYLAEMDPSMLNLLSGRLLHEMYGLGDLELLMGDNGLEEVAINSASSPITVYHKKFGWMKSNLGMESEEAIANYSSQIGRKVGREITALSPILDAHLISGDRVNATLSPVSSLGNTLTIRRFARRPWTVVDFIGKSHSMSVEMAAMLWIAIQYELNVIVAGGTASGKTSTLNALSAFIPSYHRIISIEDVREIMLPQYMRWNWVPTTTKNPNPEGLGEVTMLDLMQTALRMRPDRIILGEMRRKREAEVLFEAMHTGHSVYSTIHANSAEQVLRRLTEPPIEIPPLEVEAVDLLLVQFRDRRLNIRRTYEMAEIEAGISNEQLNVNTIYRWDPRSDSWETLNPASKFVRQINIVTGMTEKEIDAELADRAKILQWMLRKNINDMDQVGMVMKEFYARPDAIKNAAKKDLPYEKVVEL